MKREYTADQIKLLQLLSKEFPTIPKVGAEIINLNAISNLPKGTEHFMSDLHGESEAFEHILNNCSGVVREKVRDIFEKEMSEEEQRNFCTLIYYPVEKIEELRLRGENTVEWYSRTLYRLVDVARSVASKYSRSKVRKALPDAYRYAVDELLHTSGEEHNKQAYYTHIISTIIEVGEANGFIEALCSLIKRMAVDCLHVVGDIYDRGPHADRIMEMLCAHHHVDVQWGNHDIVWMGAAAGSEVCIATVLNFALQYNTLAMVENAYGISLRDLIEYAQETYKGSTWFLPRNPDDAYYVKNRMDNLSRAHEAIAVIMFKLEGQLIDRHPEYGMNARRLLDKIDYENKTVRLDGKVYELNECNFPTVDPKDPYRLTDAEEEIMRSLRRSFCHSVLLQKHVRFLYEHGSLYKVYNGNLLFHGCIPMREDGSFEMVRVSTGGMLSGKGYMDYCDKMARRAFYENDQGARDFMYYLWCGKQSPLFGRARMTTFERYFISDSDTWKEPKNPYYTMIEDYDSVCRILSEFGLDAPESHMINGHVPVRVGAGESPIKAGGKYVLIDGGFCKAYHDTTGIAGYTLIYSSRGLRLVAHGSFDGRRAAIRENKDILATTDVVFEMMCRRMLVRDTDDGKLILERMEDLKLLLEAYRSGLIQAVR